jgi:hypothetical protein
MRQLLPLILLLAACGKPKVPVVPAQVVGTCTYVNGFSRGNECRDYHGTWSEDALRADCREWQGEVAIGARCNLGELYGHCVLTKPNSLFIRVSVPGNEASRCGSSIRGCELFGGGAFDPQPICGGTVVDTGGTGLPTFQQPVLTCKAPMPGEAPGRSANGEVCTWEMISGATEPGRKFEQYASCDRVRTQRPYYGAPTAENATREDTRLNDSAYVTELNWVKEQITATACVCCHSTSAPRGTSNWYVDQPGNFINGFYDRGLAMGAGWIDTVGFGAYPAEQNNGFSRATPDRPSDSIFVTTDPARMKRFFEAELSFRGKTRADFAGQTYGAGPLDDQRFYTPKACENGEGVAADGTLKWSGPAARYVYVMEGTQAPGVPPNLDVPVGTQWRFDVPSEGSPVASESVRYGAIPEGAVQKVPVSGSPAALVPGQQYYLYVLQDIAIPVTRCLFTAR